jgi:chemotaxis protein MotA
MSHTHDNAQWHGGCVHVVATETQSLVFNPKDTHMGPNFELTLQPYARGPAAGALFGVTVVLSPIVFSAHGFLLCFSLAGLVVVLGGVVATAFMSFHASDVHTALRTISGMLRHPQTAQGDLKQDMEDIIHWSRVIKPHGLDGLRDSLSGMNARDPFINYGLNMVLSEYRPDDIRAMMETAADASYDRDCIAVDVLRAMTSHAPAFGMVGTLIGMIILLGELSENVASTGAALAVAFLSTLYGVVSARMIYMPAAARLQQEIDDRQRRHALLIEGLVMLVRGESPSHIRDRLNGFLCPDQRDYFNAISSEGVPGLAVVTVPVARLPRHNGGLSRAFGI